MSYFIPTAKINADPQEALEYAIYVIFGSYFKKTVCKNRVKENALYINYTETKQDFQYKLEELCERYAEPLFRFLPWELREKEAQVSFVKNSEGITEIRFSGEGFILRLIGRYKRKGSEILPEFWKQKETEIPDVIRYYEKQKKKETQERKKIREAMEVMRKTDYSCVVAALIGKDSRTGVDNRICQRVFQEYSKASHVVYEHMQKNKEKMLNSIKKRREPQSPQSAAYSSSFSSASS